MVNKDRIRLAEAMGWEWDTTIRGRRGYPDDWPVWIKPNGDRWFSPADMPDPFTDANDDYAVLKWMRPDEGVHIGYADGSSNWSLWSDFKDHLYELITTRTGNRRFAPWDYQIGDYARAALKVLERD